MIFVKCDDEDEEGELSLICMSKFILLLVVWLKEREKVVGEVYYNTQ